MTAAVALDTFGSGGRHVEQDVQRNGPLPGRLVDGLVEGERIWGLGEALYRNTLYAM